VTHPVQSFNTLCMSCFAVDTTVTATDGERTLYVCAACGARAVAPYGEIPKARYE
jgi:NMD protein affecting ribosome stability and mRNA decay